MEIGSVLDILRSASGAVSLKTGDLLKIKVLAVFENQRIWVDLGRCRTMAEIRFPVAAGDEFWVRVQEASGQLRLQRVEPPAETLSANKPATGSLQTVAPESLVHVRLGIEEPGDGVLGPPDSRTPNTRSAEQPFQMLQLALPLADEREPVRLKIAYRRQPAGEEREGCRAAVLLTLDRIGPIRADLFMLGRSLSISIFVSSTELQNVVARHALEVRDALVEWFDSVRVQVETSARKIERFISEDWRLEGESLVDVLA